MSALQCPICAGGTPTEYDPAAGNVVCLGCGCVLSENDIVADVTFGETSAGAATVEGAYMSANEVRARTTGPRGRQQTVESREQTLNNGRRKLAGLCRILELGDAVLEQSMRFFNLVISNNHVQGRQSTYIVASCLFLSCRMAKHPTMLIDISDILQINVFVLGSTYYRLLKDLHLNEPVPTVDPSIYISRFASMLDFGDDTHKVASDAARLVRRFNADWMSCGRRPAGIAGACLLLAARMNNFRRSTLEVVQVVKIADVTLRKRLDEFGQTPSGKLTVEEFRRVWLDEAEDPPSFTDGIKQAKLRVDKDIEALRAGSSSLEEGLPTDLVPVDLGRRSDQGAEGSGGQRDAGAEDEREAVMTRAMEEEIEGHLGSANGVMLTQQLDVRDREEYERANRGENRLDNLDEDELDRYLLNDEEVQVKERVWMEFNKEYLVKLADKKQREANGEIRPSRPRTKKAKSQPRDSSNPTGATAAESIRKMISAKPKFSKKINYNVITDLFGGEASGSRSGGAAGRRGGGAGGGGRAKKRRREDTEEDDDDGADSDQGTYGWGALNRRGSAVSSRAPSRYGTPSESGAQTPKQQYGNGLFAPPDGGDDGEDEEEEDEEDEEEGGGGGRGGGQGGAEGELADLMRRARERPGEEEEEEGEV